MQTLNIQYLVIEQAFTYLQVVSLVVNTTAAPINYDLTPVSTLFTSPVGLRPTDLLVPFISG